MLLFIRHYSSFFALPDFEKNLLRRIKVFCMKLLLLSSGVRNERAHFPAVVTEVSCPSFAAVVSSVSVSISSYLEEVRVLTHIRSDEHPLW